MQLFTFATTAVPSFIQAQLTSEARMLLFGGFAIAAMVLAIYLIILRFPNLGRFLKSKLTNLISSITGQKFEARLNKIICYHCNKGMGIYNPTYFTHGGHPHIEGTCSLCGGFIRVRLN